MAHRQPSTHFNIGKRINGCGIPGHQRLVNENQCHAMHYLGLEYQSPPSRQAQEILVCGRRDDSISKEKAPKSYRTLHTECKMARCAK
eukprot:2486327-Pleurochrysis_carterae.AAC.1